MSSNNTCTLFAVENISAPSLPPHEPVHMIDSGSYENALPIPNTYDFNFPSQYNTPALGTGIQPFPFFSSYFTPEPESFRGSRPNSPSPLIPTGLHINTVQPPEDLFSRYSTRPHSSPSTFGPATVPLVEWPAQHSIPQPRSDDEESPASFPNPTTPGPTPTPDPTPTPRHRQSFSLTSLTELQNQPRRYYPPIAPNPTGLRQMQAQAQAQKRAASEDEWESPSRKRKRSIPLSPQFEITDEDTFLLKLKDDESLSWKEIASRFQTEMGKKFQVPALQMRLKRLRERMRVWTDNDVTALKMASEYWSMQKFEIIAAKMAEYGATEKWSARQCARKLSELSSTGDQYFNPMMMMRTPTFSTSHTSSPTEGPAPGFISPFATLGPFSKNRTFTDTSA